MPLELRHAFLRELELLRDHADVLVWTTAAAYLETGSTADELADALGLSRASFYRRLTAHRERTDTLVVPSSHSGQTSSQNGDSAPDVR